MRMNFKGFWSYRQADDKTDTGRIRQLAHDIVDEYGAITGETIELFLDRDSIEWGSLWESDIREALESVAFFVPVLTPRYIASEQCRNEAMKFSRRMENEDLSALWLPLHYIDIPHLSEKSSSDELLEICRARQWEDWRATRFADLGSSEYRRAVHSLAKRIEKANRNAENRRTSDDSRNTADASQCDESDAEAAPEDEPAGLNGPLRGEKGTAEEEAGWLDAAVEIMDLLPEWNDTMTSMTATTREITEKLENAGNRAKATSDFALKRKIVRGLAAAIRGDVGTLEGLESKFVSDLSGIDTRMLVFFDWLRSAATEEAEQETVEKVYASISELAAGLEDMFGSIREADGGLAGLENISRDIRPVIRRWRMSLLRLREARSIARGWTDIVTQHRS